MRKLFGFFSSTAFFFLAISHVGYAQNCEDRIEKVEPEADRVFRYWSDNYWAFDKYQSIELEDCSNNKIQGMIDFRRGGKLYSIECTVYLNIRGDIRKVCYFDPTTSQKDCYSGD